MSGSLVSQFISCKDIVSIIKAYYGTLVEELVQCCNINNITNGASLRLEFEWPTFGPWSLASETFNAFEASKSKEGSKTEALFRFNANSDELKKSINSAEILLDTDKALDIFFKCLQASQLIKFNNGSNGSRTWKKFANQDEFYNHADRKSLTIQPLYTNFIRKLELLFRYLSWRSVNSEFKCFMYTDFSFSDGWGNLFGQYPRDEHNENITVFEITITIYQKDTPVASLYIRDIEQPLDGIPGFLESSTIGQRYLKIVKNHYVCHRKDGGL